MILWEYISIINVVETSSQGTPAVNVEGAVLLILFSLMVASVGLFLQECYQSGMILRRYYVWLNYLYIKNRRTKNEKEKRQEMLKRFIKAITKPLGLCIYCQSTWICIISFLTVFSLCTINDLFFLVCSIGMTFLWLRLLEKALD